MIKRKKYHEVNAEEAINALTFLKNEPHFKKYIEVREAMREETIRGYRIARISRTKIYTFTSQESSKQSMKS